MFRRVRIKQQWDTWGIRLPVKGVHPVVLISHPDHCACSRVINALYCTSQRQTRAPLENEVILDTEDGLDWQTFCACDHLLSIDSAELLDFRGHVTFERRRTIRQKIIALFRLLASD